MSGFSNPIAGGGGGLTIPRLKSPDYVPGVSGWTINKDGSAEFNNLDIRGTFNGTDFIINNQGAFFYSGTPAPGNLIASVASAGGTDQFGNIVVQGITVYGPSQSGAQLLPGTIPQVTLYPGGWTIAQAWPALFAAIASAGTAAERYAFNLVSGYPTAGIGYQTSVYGQGAAGDGSADGFVSLSIASAAGTPAGVNVTPGQAVFQMPVLATHPGSGIVPETWQPITLDAGWSATVTPQYRMLSTGSVEVRGQVTHAGVTTLTSINNSSPVPAGYRPPVTRFVRAPTAGDLAGTVSLTPGGVFQMRASGFTATAAILDGIYSL